MPNVIVLYSGLKALIEVEFRRHPSLRKWGRYIDVPFEVCQRIYEKAPDTCWQIALPVWDGPRPESMKANADVLQCSDRISYDRFGNFSTDGEVTDNIIQKVAGLAIVFALDNDEIEI